jgi:HSP20 family protein
VDITEDEDTITVEAELPGFRRDEVDVTMTEGILRIAAERRAEPSEREGGTQHLRERRFTRVERAFTLPAAVETDGVEATLEDGVLHVTLQKAQAAKPARIQVK